MPQLENETDEQYTARARVRELVGEVSKPSHKWQMGEGRVPPARHGAGDQKSADDCVGARTTETQTTERTAPLQWAAGNKGIENEWLVRLTKTGMLGFWKLPGKLADVRIYKESREGTGQWVRQRKHNFGKKIDANNSYDEWI